MNAPYPGPLRQEPLAVELYNTVYAVRGELIDGLETPADLSAWIAGLGERLPVSASDVDLTRHAEFLALRGAVRDGLHAVLEGKPVPDGPLHVINRAAAQAASWPTAVQDAKGRLNAETRYRATDPTALALGALAADAVEVLAGSSREDLRACGAPGCVLMFLKDHPRKRWCSAACGNRARQARHYQRKRGTLR
jgi:predicted RNA-binding Zn ribbon-like protein